MMFAVGMAGKRKIGMFKDNLIQIRKMRKMTQEDVAEKVGVTRQAVAKWESGETVPDLDKCRILAEVFGVAANQQQPQAEQLPPPPPVVTAVPVPIVPEKTIVAGMKQVAVIVWEITDAAKLDRKFLSPDERKIRAFADDIKKNGLDAEAIVEPGIVFHKEIRMDVK